jgi:5'-phosphate synthase pdxT subunit
MMRCCRTVAVNIGVLDLQGDVSEHIQAFQRALNHTGEGGSRVIPVRNASDISCLDALAIPGGESTTISRLIRKNHLQRAIQLFEGGIFATCAGMVLMATDVDDPRVECLGLMDITVIRNAFGRQKESFEVDLPVKYMKRSFHAIFIRAPCISRCGAGVEQIARLPQGVVAVEQGLHSAFAFHPELVEDTRIHEHFIRKIITGSTRYIPPI